VLLPVKIENDALRMEVRPQLGGKVSSLIDKADRFELLFNYPAELPTTSKYDLPYASGWYAGWDECFPAIAKGPYVGHPYDGIMVPDHGELWSLPTTAVPTKDGITSVWNGLRFGYRLTRKLFLDGPTLHAEYTLINLGPFPLRFVWALHALMDMSRPVQIELPPRPFKISPDEQENEQAYRWPMANGLDLSRLTDLPPERSWKTFCSDPISGSLRLIYPDRSRSLRMAYESDSGLDAYWGIWINTGQWMHHRHFAIEPTTGRYDALDASIRDNSAGKVAGGGRCEWRVSWTVG
jgi:galactose mutarotase-like enzyme